MSTKSLYTKSDLVFSENQILVIVVFRQNIFLEFSENYFKMSIKARELLYFYNAGTILRSEKHLDFIREIKSRTIT